MADQNFSAWLGGPLFIKLKKWGNGAQNSGAAGRRKSRKRNIITKALADEARSHGIVVFCGDQHRNQGTGYRGNFKGKGALT